MYDYIIEKAGIFLRSKPEIYREKNALGMPAPELSDIEIYTLIHGCAQIREGGGQSSENPLTGIGIHGFYLLVELFHFEVVRQSIECSSEDGFLDKMECIHIKTGIKLVLYNFVRNIS